MTPPPIRRIVKLPINGDVYRDSTGYWRCIVITRDGNAKGTDSTSDHHLKSIANCKVGFKSYDLNRGLFIKNVILPCWID